MNKSVKKGRNKDPEYLLKWVGKGSEREMEELKHEVGSEGVLTAMERILGIDVVV